MQLQTYKIKTLTDSNQIFSKLQNGTNLPVMGSLKKYIVNEIERMNGFSIIIEDGTGQVVGHSLLYEWDSIMYFAFFSAKNDDVEMINKLMDEIQRIAKERKCKSILGPVNLPPIIYGYGFAEAGSEPTIFASAPHNNPIYIELFKQRNYTIWHRVLHFRIPLSPIKLENKWDVHAVDFSKPDEWKKDFVEIQVKTFPPSAQITPNRLPAFNDYMEFIQEFGYEEGVLLAHHEGKAIGAGWATPNPFDLNEKGKCQTLLLFGGAVLPEYQCLQLIESYFIRSHVQPIYISEKMNFELSHLGFFRDISDWWEAQTPMIAFYPCTLRTQLCEIVSRVGNITENLIVLLYFASLSHLTSSQSIL